MCPNVEYCVIDIKMYDNNVDEMEINSHFSLLSSVCVVCQMLSLMEAQALFFQQGYQSLAELENYRKQLKDEVRCDLSTYTRKESKSVSSVKLIDRQKH